MLRVMVIGQKWLGAEIWQLCREKCGIEPIIAAVPSIDDRLAKAAKAGGGSAIEHGPIIDAKDVPAEIDLIVAAHAHCFITEAARRRARLGAIGYHPSLLPLHRGRDAVRWAIRDHDRITGGSVYWLNDKADAGEIAAQDWCFIRPGDDAASLWRRELAPMGCRLMQKVLSDIAAGKIVAVPQEENLATWEPAIRGNLSRLA